MLRVLAVTAPAVIGVLTAAGTAAATVTLQLHSSHQGVLATQFVSPDCAKDGDVPPPGTDKWVFVLPKNDAEFVSLSVSFKTLGGTTTTIAIPDGADAYPDGITSNGTSRAWVITPSGWTLLDGSAVLSGPTKAEFFNLTHTCIGASTTPTPSAPSSPSGSPSTSASASTSPSTSASVSGGASEAGSPSPSTSTALASNNGSLPLTGAAIGGLVLTGLTAVGLGAAVLWLRRRRDTPEFTAE